jgi:hypothetical protein
MISIKIDLWLEFYKSCSGIMTECNSAWPTASFFYGIKHSQDAQYVWQVASSSQEFCEYQLPPNVRIILTELYISTKIFLISSCWLENPKKSLNASGRSFFHQSFRVVKFGSTTDSFIFTKQPAILYNFQHSLTQMYHLHLR